MELTWKDGINTVLAALIAIALVASIRAYSWPLLGSYRLGALILGIAGISMCVMSSADPSSKTTWNYIGVALGTIAGLLVLLTLILGSKILLLALAVDILVLWAITTLHHIVGN